MSLCHYAFDDFSSFVLGLFFFRFVFFLPVWICADAVVWKTRRWEGVFMVTLDESLLQQLSMCVPAPSETLWYAESVPSNRIRSAWTAQSNYITSESFLVLQYLLRISHTVGTAPARPVKTHCPRSELFTSQPAMSWEFCLEASFSFMKFVSWKTTHIYCSIVYMRTSFSNFMIHQMNSLKQDRKEYFVLFLFFKVCTY